MQTNNKRQYISCEVNIVYFDEEDVVRVSGFYTDWDDFESSEIEGGGIEPGIGG